MPDKNLKISYESPKTDIRSQQGGPVYIREEDIVNLGQKEILNAANSDKAPFVWKTHYWGSWRDKRLLSRLMVLPKLTDLAGEIGENKRWIKGQGIQPNGGDVNPVWWSPSTLYLNSNTKFDLAISKHDTSTVELAGIPTDTVHRPREKRIFTGPKVIVSQGSKNMKVAFCNFKVVFRHALQTITGKKPDANFLRFLSAAIKSDVIQYYLFHTSSNWGIERERVDFHELLSLPFFLPIDAPNHKKAQEIINKIANVIKEFEKKIETDIGWFGHKERAASIRDNVLEPLVREYYDIDKYEAMLIEDTLQLAVKSFHPKQYFSKVPTTFKRPTDSACIIYAQTLYEMLNNFGRGSKFKVKAEIIKGRPYSIVRVAMTDRTCRTIPVSTSDGELSKIFNRMKTLLQHKQGHFVFCQNLKVFDGNSLYILKPMQMRFWSRTAALNDADEIASAILNLREPK